MVRVFNLTFCLFLAFATGCNSSSSSDHTGTGKDGSGKQHWVATTGHVYDALNRISEGADVEIKLLCGPGIDPHSYSASPRDVQAMSEADAIFFNGFHLEAKLHDLLHHEFGDKSWSMGSVFPEEARLDWMEDGEIDPEAPFDPHIWNHLPAWSTCVSGLIEQLVKIDSENEELYRTNGEKYVAEIEELHKKALEEFAKIPEKRRVIVSAHDAFNYFAKVYGFKSVAVLGIGNDAEADVKTMREVAELVSERKVPVIFLETITNPKVTEALQEACAARDWSVKIADQPLHSDDLGSEPPLDTFLGAFEANINLITKSLAGG
ncbi:metal ABC transporter solute-binding protein, Zn/Mn family [Thalassoroseus pseudoceratinae]|uniref:metal ABC transporter solute-binding protein, Zn/Mn family n=1 Tax=Thalassoroseus pseudoceratinae TaxID=2713176 RepID=UPI001422A625|nr:zinc ABC transporter substrate-binding protein [Thalassoroseus pseudoceratinae]